MTLRQTKIQQLIDDIRDNLHATSINLQATITSLDFLHIPQLHQELTYLQTLLENIKGYISQRQQLFINFLMTNQIQQEQESVRRERMQDYQDKIYEQRRIMTDKETCFQSLLRPKYKRHPNQTTEQFQEMRSRERQSEDRNKNELLSKELACLQKLKEFLKAQQQSAATNINKDKLKRVYLKPNVNCTGTSIKQGDPIFEKDIPLQQQLIITNNMSHRRTASLQYTVERSHPINTQVGQYLQNASLKVLLDQILQFRHQNEELLKIYEQQRLSLKFKQRQVRHTIEQYSMATKKRELLNQKLKKISLENHWQHSRCFAPVARFRKVSSMEKYAAKFQ